MGTPAEQREPDICNTRGVPSLEDSFSGPAGQSQRLDASHAPKSPALAARDCVSGDFAGHEWSPEACPVGPTVCSLQRLDACHLTGHGDT